ncbi:MAG: hypothetical protein OFPI_05720 [Osedax symbiont Rs2]|nr:MAG: hypothetical protein OFPI_05720 [Osedax symbiont Rs2]
MHAPMLVISSIGIALDCLLKLQRSWVAQPACKCNSRI